jgi:hypothetical protein
MERRIGAALRRADLFRDDTSYSSIECLNIKSGSSNHFHKFRKSVANSFIHHMPNMVLFLSWMFSGYHSALIVMLSYTSSTLYSTIKTHGGRRNSIFYMTVNLNSASFVFSTVRLSFRMTAKHGTWKLFSRYYKVC